MQRHLLIQVLSEGKTTFNSIFGGKKSRQNFTHYTFLKMSLLKINKAALYEHPVKTTPQNVQEANEALFTAKWNLPKAAKHCGMTQKEMKLTFFEYLKYNPVTYQV
jgi:hypothetical protein